MGTSKVSKRETGSVQLEKAEGYKVMGNQELADWFLVREGRSRAEHTTD